MIEKRYRFYIDDIELKHDPYNWNDVGFGFKRDRKYHGVFRTVSLKNITFVKEDALRIQSIRDKGSVNTNTTFRIDRQCNETFKYYTEQESVLNYTKYQEIQEVGKGFIVQVGVVDSHELNKLRSRQANELIIGQALSVEDVAINALPLIDVEYERKKLRFFSGWRWSENLQLTYLPGQAFEPLVPDFSNYSSFGNPTNEKGHLGLELINSNDNSARSQTHVTYSPDYAPQLSGMIFTESPIERTVTMEGNFDFNIAVIDGQSNNVSRDYLLSYSLTEFLFDDNLGQYVRQFDIVNVGQVVTLDQTVDPLVDGTAPFDGLLDIVPLNGRSFVEANISVPMNASFQKVRGRAYGIVFNLQSVNPGIYTTDDLIVYGRIQENGDNYLNAYYEDNLNEYPNSKHLSQLNYECGQSLLEQITDRPNIMRSSILGRTDLIDPSTQSNYLTDGLSSLYALTDGFLLRDGKNADNTEHNLTLNFEAWFRSNTAMFGWGIWWDGEYINIEKRSDMYNTNAIELDPSKITKELIDDLMYTQVKVGNEKVNNETVNGTNEHNTIQYFTVPQRVKENTLELKTEYKTSYTDTEETRRLALIQGDNVDSKNDNFIFFNKVKRKTGGWVTVLGFDGFDIISGVILPEYAGNLDITPKRMLFNNMDLISACYYQSSMNLKFERTENLAPLVSRKIGGTTITELSNITKVEMTDHYFNPVLYTLEVGAKDLINIVSNPLNSYKFKYGCGEIEGFLWNATLKYNSGIIQVIEKL